MGRLSDLALEAANGIEGVLRGRSPNFVMNYPAPVSLAQGLVPSWFPILPSQVLLAEKLRRFQASHDVLVQHPENTSTVVSSDGTIYYQSPASRNILGHSA
jgi:hypothetical protein